jgi:hypothetical protein
MIAFDYPMEPVQLSTAERSTFYFVDLPLNLVRLGGWLTMNKIAEKKGSGVPEHRLKNGAQ